MPKQQLENRDSDKLNSMPVRGSPNSNGEAAKQYPNLCLHPTLAANDVIDDG